MTVRERGQVEEAKAKARQQLLKLAEARVVAEIRYQEANDVMAAAWRANQARTDDLRHTNTSAVAATGLPRSTLVKWAKADASGDEPTRPDGDYTLDDLAELARARRRAMESLDARSETMATEWRAIQDNPRTRLKVQPVERLTGVARSTLGAWLSGTVRPTGQQIARRTAAPRDGVELDGDGVLAAAAVLIGRDYAATKLNSDDRHDLAREVVAAYLHAANHTPR